MKPPKYNLMTKNVLVNPLGIHGNTSKPARSKESSEERRQKFMSSPINNILNKGRANAFAGRRTALVLSVPEEAFLYLTGDVLNILNSVVIKMRYYKLVDGLSFSINLS